jgi:acyl-homoserine lactone synthase
MIHLINAANRHLYGDVLAQMHRARTDHFVEERGWRNLCVEAGQELDEYDNDQALYLVGFDEFGAIAVSARLLPADHGCVLSDHFPHLVVEGRACGPGVFELSRYFASPALRGRRHFPVKASMNLAVVEAMVERRARRLVGFTDLHILGIMRYSGWRVRPIGLPAAYDEGTAAAFEIACQAHDLAEMQAAVELPGRQLFEAPAWLPHGSDVRSLADVTSLVINLPSELRAPALEVVSRTMRDWRPQGDLGPLFARLGERAAA